MPKPTQLMTSPTKTWNQNFSIVFNPNKKTCCIFQGIEQLSSSIG